MSFQIADAELNGSLTQSSTQWRLGEGIKWHLLLKGFKVFNYCLTQSSSINILPFIGEWEHFEIATFHMLLPELYFWTESIYFICTCKQVFISALRSCVQFIQVMKNIHQVTLGRIPLKLSVITNLPDETGPRIL